MIRVCPHSDAQCKHGMSCPYTCATDAYDGTKALLPPAPDGATEGWRLGAGGARRAASPSVSPVRPKGEDEGATVLDLAAAFEAGHAYGRQGWGKIENAERAEARQRAKAYAIGQMDALAPSQPSQTGEESAGLVERANEALIAEARHMARHAIGTRGIKALFNRLADALASRSPIPGETPETINAWALETFGPISGSASVAARANKEMAELLTKCIEGATDAEIAEETADVVIVLYRMMAVLGFDLFGAINRKMAVNRTRRWVIKNGHGQHIEGAPSYQVAEGGKGG